MSREKLQTRAQRDLILAERLVSAVEKEAEVRRIYGGLCHRFPILVRTAGLCQALAFSSDKATNRDTPRGRAHAFLLDHVGVLLGADDPLAAVRTAELAAYLHQTRRVLAAWVYFKRFAVSILKVEPSEEAEDENGR